MPRQRSVGSPVAPSHPHAPSTTPACRCNYTAKILTVDDPVLNCSTVFLAPDHRDDRAGAAEVILLIFYGNHTSFLLGYFFPHDSTWITFLATAFSSATNPSNKCQFYKKPILLYIHRLPSIQFFRQMIRPCSSHSAREIFLRD